MRDIGYLTIFVFVLLLNSLSMKAQHNPYKINDALYSYYIKAANNLSAPLGYRMADTLFVRARQKRQLKAQCMALFLKVQHYYVIKDYAKMNVEFKRVIPFMLRTPYLQYYFGVWTYPVTAYINQGKYREALLELAKYQDEAFLHKNHFGIMWSYTMQGDVYSQQKMYRLALSQYSRAVRYGEVNNSINVGELYQKIGRCYFHLRSWKLGEKYLLKSISFSLTPCYSLISYMSLLSLYCTEDVVDAQKIVLTYGKIKSLLKECALQKNQIEYYDECMYYYFKYYRFNEAKAAKYLAHHTFEVDSLIYYYKSATLATGKNQHKEASTYYKNFCNSLFENNVKAQQAQLDWVVPQLEYQNVQHKKSQLLQSQKEMQLQQTINNGLLLSLSNERDRALLEKNQKQRDILMKKLMNQKLIWQERNKQMKLDKMELQQRQRNSDLSNEREVWRLIFICSLLMALLVVIGTYFVLNYRTRRRLKVEKERAENSEQLKSLFFQNMNHEIRSPLNAILGFNEVLNSDMSEELTAEQKSEFINMISTNSHLLLTLVNDVLDLSNFEGGTYKLTPVDVDIQHLCHTTLESIRGRQAKGVNLFLKTTPSGPFILHTDAQRLQQVLTNFLTNACKYTERGSIILSYDVLPEVVRFTVIDTGCGVKGEDAEKVFERFQMLDKAKRGTGLGLHICRLISDLLHGRTYLDTSYKGGAKFVFEHPLKSVFMALIALCCSFQTVKADKLSVNDDLERYCQSVRKELVPTVRYKMADTLYVMAKKKGNVEMQSVAYQQMAFSNYLQRGDSLETILQRCKKLSQASRNAKVSMNLFLIWSYVINQRLMTKDYKGAMSQLMDYRQAVMRTKDKEALGIYFNLAGNFYAFQQQYGSAVSYYLQTLNSGKKNLHACYEMLSRCYYSMRQYDKVVMYASKAYETSVNDRDRFVALLTLLKCYCYLNDKAKATEMLQKFEDLKAKSKMKPSPNDMYLAYSHYYELNKDMEKAREARKMAGDGEGTPGNMAEYYYAAGDYEKAEPLFKKLAEYYSNWFSDSSGTQYDFYISRFDYLQMMRENDRIAMNNIKLKLQRANSDRQLLLLQKNRNSWLLQREFINVLQKKSEVELQNTRLTHQHNAMLKQRRLAAGAQEQIELSRQRTEWIWMTVAFVLIFCVALGLFFGYRVNKKERKLRAEAKAASEAERAKNRFFLNVENQIKRPLDTIVDLNLRLNGENGNVLLPDDRSRLLQELRGNSQQLTKLVNNVLDISKLESGTYRLQLDTVKVHTFCLSLLDEIKPQLADGVELFLNYSGGDESGDWELTTDVKRLHFVLYSYLSNACHYTLDGSITLSYELLPELIRFSVTDTGRGITLRNVEDIFHIGKQKADEGHLGLSLHLVRLIAEVLQGRAYVDASCQSGTCFVFEQPLHLS